MSRIPEWWRQEHARMQTAFGGTGKMEDSDMALHLAAALLSMPDDLRAAVDGTARAMARDRIRDCDQQSVPLEMALAVYGGCAAEIWVEIKRRAAGRKS